MSNGSGRVSSMAVALMMRLMVEMWRRGAKFATLGVSMLCCVRGEKWEEREGRRRGGQRKQ